MSSTQSNTGSGSSASAAPSTSRSWFEGTLDVISGGMSSKRSTTPVPRRTSSNSNLQQMVPPSSPGGGGACGIRQMIHRLPSQDSLDRSIHNDSGHGNSNKSNAQMIRELRQSNARLTARTAAMEAEFMNQLNEQTKLQEETEDRLRASERHVQTLEARCQNAEHRLRERDDHLQKLKEESAFQRHSISDLRTQVHQLEAEAVSGRSNGIGSNINATRYDAGNWRAEKDNLLQDVADLQEQAERLREERESYREKSERLQRQIDVRQTMRVRFEEKKKSEDGGDDASSIGTQEHAWHQLEQTQDALYRTETALVDLQNEQKRSKAGHERELEALQDELAAAREQHEDAVRELKDQISALENRDLEGDWQTQLVDRDAKIQTLREQVLEYSSQLTELTSEIARVKADAEQQESYRREEAEDLRVLNDAQEDEIELLRKQLEDAAHEIEIREQEARDRSTDAKAAEELQQELDNVKKELAEVRTALEELQERSDKAQIRYEQEVQKLNDTVRGLTTEKEALTAMAKSASDMKTPSADSPKKRGWGFGGNNLDGDMDEGATVKELTATVRALETRSEFAERQLTDARTTVAKLEAAREILVQEYETKLTKVDQDYKDTIADMEVEAKLLRKKTTDAISPRKKNLAGEATTDEVGGSATTPPHGHSQAVGSVEADLRKQLEAAKQQVKDVRNELQMRLDVKEREAMGLVEKLDDRDTTISALVKSSVSLEQQLASCRIEIDALRKRFEGTGSEAGCDVVLTESSALRDEIEDLKAAMEDLQRTEQRLLEENRRLQNQAQDVRLENSRLRTRLEAYKSENMVLRSQVDEDETGSNSGNSVLSASQHVQIQERDAAISNLVQQSIEQDRVVSELQSRLRDMTEEVEALRANPPAPEIGQPWEEIQELRKETEMFAGQVIEQDEEIESLKNMLLSKEAEQVNLEKQIESLKASKEAAEAAAVEAVTRQPAFVAPSADPDKIKELTAEIDELKESNQVLMDEIRLLRRKAGQFEASDQTIDRLKKEVQDADSQAREFERQLQAVSREKADLQKEVEKARSTGEETQKLQKELDELERSLTERVCSLEAKLLESKKTIESLEQAAAENADAAKYSPKGTSNADEMEVESLKSEIEVLKRNLSHQSDAVDKAKNTIRELEKMLADKNSIDAAAWDDEKDELIAEIESLTQQLEEAQEELKQLEEQKTIIEDFKSKLEDADEAREASEKTIVDTYERKLSLLTLNKDVAIDKLRKELSQSKASSAAQLEQMSVELNACEEEMNRLRDELTSELQERDSRIFALQHTLEAQEQLAHNMKTEMDHLQGSMENNVVSRREEVDELQKDLVDMTSKLAQQEREIKSLQGQMHDKKIEYDAEVSKLKETIAKMEEGEDSDERRTAEDLKMEIRIKEVKERLEKLQWKNTSLSQENAELRDRLARTEPKIEQLEGVKHDLEKRSQAVEDLKAEVATLRGMDPDPQSQSSSSSKKKPPLPNPSSPSSVAQVPPNGASRSGKRSSTSDGNNKSAVTPRRLGFLGRRVAK